MLRLSFIYPAMLWLLAGLGLIWGLALITPRRLPAWRFWSSLGLRTLIALCLILAIAGAQLVRPVDQLTTVFLLDGSDSLPPSIRAQAETFIQEALQKMPDDDRAAIVVFGGNALVERAPSEERRLGRISSVPVVNRTNIADAIQLGLALFPADAQKRLVLLSDGGENDGQAIEAARIAAARKVPIAVINLALNTGDAEALVARVEAPAHVRDGQSTTLTTSIESTVAQAATVRLIGDSGVIAEQKVQLEPGANQVSFEVTISGSGFQRYRIQLEPTSDERVQNNEAAAMIQVQGPPRVLVVAAEPAEAAPLMSALKATNVTPELVPPEGMPGDLAGLSEFEAVLLVNVPARSLPVKTMAALPGYVRDLGKGLVMIGGEKSFGVGGYGRTPIEEAMPVYMDVRDREERPDLALVFVIDKSGSMDACHCASSDRGSTQLSTTGTRKVDIAKEAVAQAAALLGPRDQIGVITFDSQAFQTLPVTQGATVDTVIDAVADVEPRGSTNVRAGLLEAEDVLQHVDARIKHIVLLTDGWGGGGDQADIAQRLHDAGITLSVVAAGGGSAEYLERLAQTGGGRYYPAQDIADVPQIFVQETITTIGNYIVERPFYPTAMGESPILAGIDKMPALYGFNGSTIKESARLVLATDDEQPLLATWQYGLGHSAAWLSDTKGKWAIDWMSWDNFPRFAGQLIGAVLPTQGSQEISTNVTVSGSETVIHLDTGTTTPGDMKVVATVLGGDGKREEIELNQVGPSQFQGQIASPSPGTYLVQIAGNSGDRVMLQETAGMVVPYSPEYRGAQGNPALLDELTAITGGTQISEPSESFAPVDELVTSAQEIGLPLLILALLLLPLDIALRRLMLRRSDFVAAGAWARARANRPAMPPPADPTLERLAGAKRRVAARISGEPVTPTSPPTPPPDVKAKDTRPADTGPQHLPPTPPPAQPEDPLARLREAKARARKRVSGEE